MKAVKTVAALALTIFGHTAVADLTPFKDYDLSSTVSNVTTVKVDSNMVDKYLEGLSKTWAPTNDILVEQGQIESYSIYLSELQNSGDFNIILVVRTKDASQREPNQKRFEAFMEKWGEKNKEMSDKIVVTYPDIRTITGEYMMREVTLK